MMMTTVAGQPPQQARFHRVPASPPDGLLATKQPRHSPPLATVQPQQQPDDERDPGRSYSPPSSHMLATSSSSGSTLKPNHSHDDDHEDAREHTKDDVTSDHYVAANVLLLAVAASNERSRLQQQQQQQQQQQEQGMDDDTASLGADTVTSSSIGSGPLKKRKTVVDVLRQKPEDQLHHHPEPCHVSPMSHGSKTLASETPASTPNSTNEHLMSTSRALSYEFKDDALRSKTHTPNSGVLKNSQNNNKSSPTGGNGNNASNHHASSIGNDSSSNHTSPNSATQFPPATNSNNAYNQHHSNGLVPYFASALHWLLTESSSQTASTEYAAARSVLQWVPHGQAWRVVRWDTLRKQVMPQFFPQLAGSIDAFLWHLTAWGFEEIQDGPDVGAFGHTVSSSGGLLAGRRDGVRFAISFSHTLSHPHHNSCDSFFAADIHSFVKK